MLEPLPVYATCDLGAVAEVINQAAVGGAWELLKAVGSMGQEKR
jgi:hypothetical protein